MNADLREISVTFNTLVIFAAASLFIAWPLAIWKLIDIARWLTG